ncbi:hypothetical protein KY289_014185 [Solanum tuberosum]|nr:hypothetical protein KY289_014185 [Solanum tuberosum]
MQFHAFLNFDGASKGNPGLAGAGAVLRAVDGSVVYWLREGLGFATNNVAEYRGVILGLKYVLEKALPEHCGSDGFGRTPNVEVGQQNELNTEADMLANLAVLLNRMLAFADGETQVEST